MLTGIANGDCRYLDCFSATFFRCGQKSKKECPMKPVRRFLLLFVFSLGIVPLKVSATPSTALLRAYHEKLKAMNLPPGLEEIARQPEVIREVTLAPLFDQPFVCSEHPLGQMTTVGDALGTDCMVVGGVTKAGGFFQLFRGSGRNNKDWYGWHVGIHAPFDGTVTYVHVNPVTNRPGITGKSPAGMIVFRRDDGMMVVYAHVQDIRVKEGDQVKSGDVIAFGGNNGVARNPYIHVGAYQGLEPFQIRWDLAAMGAIPTLRSN